MVDTERFRLRRFVQRLIEAGECEVRDQPIDLVDVAAVLDGNSRATLFRAAGPEKAELVGNVMGSRRRLAIAFDTDEAGLLPTLAQRLSQPQAPVKVPAKEAPVQAVVLTGKDADLCALPVHLQHSEDGAPYISASLDFTRVPSTGFTNVGCRRIMLRGPRTAGIDLIAPSDLRAIYLDAVSRGENLPIAFAVGSHPADFMAAVSATPPMDELAVIGAVRGAPVPIVKCISNDVWVPADAEYVLEGHLDAKGHVEPEGPFGEYVGYYGVVKRNPVFHLTAITRRKDALFQTVTIGGRHLARTDTAQVTTVKTESAAWAGLITAVREPVAVFATPSSGGMYNVRVSLRQRVPGEARNAIAAVFGSMAEAKHVFVFDDDIDVFSDEQVDWALATRYQGDRDLITAGGFRVVPLDPSLGGARTGAKVGFDCTIPFGKRASLEWGIPAPPVMPKRARSKSVADTLAAEPASFLELMAASGSRDGREIVRELDALYAANRLTRNENGRYVLKSGAAS
ncbi:MAG TPA: UbiD family decarboxylase [Xanthobacteraceae bacterium]|nr:UbiD family decarboxylase [Xanthobacteraceae bacterium]